MKIIYQPQETTWTCGPSCMRMILGSLGMVLTEKRLTKLLKTNKMVGTKADAFPFLAKKLGLDYVAMDNATMADIRRLQRKGYRIIVHYHYRPVKKRLSFEKRGHYAVLKSIGKNSISLYNPDRNVGPDDSYSIEYFKKIWTSRRQKYPCWLFAARK